MHGIVRHWRGAKYSLLAFSCGMMVFCSGCKDLEDYVQGVMSGDHWYDYAINFGIGFLVSQASVGFLPS